VSQSYSRRLPASEPKNLPFWISSQSVHTPKIFYVQSPEGQIGKISRKVKFFNFGLASHLATSAAPLSESKLLPPFTSLRTQKFTFLDFFPICPHPENFLCPERGHYPLKGCCRGVPTLKIFCPVRGRWLPRSCPSTDAAESERQSVLVWTLEKLLGTDWKKIQKGKKRKMSR
jgi:hypothetical protein